jgi:regulator of nonsense transcripts 2
MHGHTLYLWRPEWKSEANSEAYDDLQGGVVMSLHVDETTAASSSQQSTSAVASTSKLTLERDKRRLALRTANERVWQDGPSPPKGPLDSNIKKNTAYIKRIRQTLGTETKEQLAKDSLTLNLDKYIEEIVQAIPEGLSKCTNAKDCLAAAETISLLHTRFDVDQFAKPLAGLITSQLATPTRAALQAVPQEQREKDEGVRVQKQKVLLRAAAELALVEVIRTDKGKARASALADTNGDHHSLGQEWLYLTLREFLANDREHVNVPIVLSILKAFGSTLIGKAVSNADEDNASKLNSLSLADTHLVGPDMQASFRKLCETYFNTLGKRIVKENSRLQEQDRRNHEAYIRSGEIFEDRQQSYEKMMRSFEKLHEWGKLMSDLLGIPLPPLTTDSKSSAVGLAVNLDSRSSALDRADVEYAPGKSAWEDEDTRRFYEELIDLAEMVPPSLLTNSTAKVDMKEETRDSQPSQVRAEPAIDSKAPTSPPLGHEADGEAADLAAGPAAQLNAFLAGLPELNNRASIDSAAMDFAFLNSKTARKRLVKQLTSVPRNRSDLIPYYGRLIATLNKYMPDVGTGVVSYLDDDFRAMQRKRNADLSEARAKNLRYLGELTKFGVTPLITIFHCLKVCLDDFSGPNVENVATLLETCGRFLLRSEETGERMKSTLELLRRKRAAQNLDARQLVLLDNAYYQCNPPERDVVAAKQRTPMERYITHLMYDVLRRGTQDKVLKQLRKLPWQDDVARETLHNVFVRSWRIKFSNLHLLAVLMHDLQVFHNDFVVKVIDTVCEQIRFGMETNIFKDNQRRVATLKYFGELYNYRLVNSDMIFEQLWALVTFGHRNGQPLPGQTSPIDAPDDYFRIRLVCTLLDSCGMCFDRGELRKRLDDYLLMLNVYLLSKEQPLPMDIDFMLSDTLEALRPDFAVKMSFEEAAAAVDAMLAEQQAERDKKAAMQAAEASSPDDVKDATKVDHDKDDSDSSSSASSDDDPRQISKDDASTDSESSSEDEGSSSDDDDERELVENEDEEDDIGRGNQRSQADIEAEDEFSRELAKLMAESNAGGQTAATNRAQRGLFDIGVPFVKKSGTAAASANAAGLSGGAGDVGDTAVPLPAQHMRFSLLSKKGNKQQTHEVHVPLDAALAVHSRANEEQQQAERQQLKKLVLGMETREQADDRVNFETSMARRSYRPRQSHGD